MREILAPPQPFYTPQSRPSPTAESRFLESARFPDGIERKGDSGWCKVFYSLFLWTLLGGNHVLFLMNFLRSSIFVMGLMFLFFSSVRNLSSSGMKRWYALCHLRTAEGL